MPQTRSLSSRRVKDEATEDSTDVLDTAATRSEAFKDSLEKYHYAAPTPPRTERRSLRSTSRTPLVMTGDTAPTSTTSPTTPGPSSSQRKKRPSSALQPTTPNSASPSTANKKRKRQSSKYAPPSTYSHLAPLTDILAGNLISVFIGTNPGIRTAALGHAYAHPSNMFWKLVHSSGCTSRRLKPEEDGTLVADWGLGNTNIVERATRDAGELSKVELAAGTPILEAKLRKYRPESVCIVGKGIWESVWRWRHGKNPTKDQFKWGWQDQAENMGVVDGEWDGARVFVTSSTSGLSASLRPHEKEAIWKPFGEWVSMRREERADAGVPLYTAPLPDHVKDESMAPRDDIKDEVDEGVTAIKDETNEDMMPAKEE